MDEVYLVNEATLSRLGKVAAVLANVKKAIQTQGKRRNQRLCSKQKNKIKLQKRTLIKLT
mgnify:CR=1 FL=1